MGRTKKAITEEGPTATFATELRTARKTAGDPTYREMSMLANCSYTALSQADSGKKLPTWEVAKAYLKACGVTNEEDVAAWRERWSSTKRAVDLRKELHRPASRSRRPELPTKQMALSSDAASPLANHAGHTLARNLDGVNTMHDLVNALNDLVASQGLNLTALSRRIDDATLSTLDESPTWQCLTTDTVRQVLTGKTRPTLDVVTEVVTACGRGEELPEWTDCLRRIESSERKAQAQLDQLLEQIKTDIQATACVQPTTSAIEDADRAASAPEDHPDAWRARWDRNYRYLALITALPVLGVFIYVVLAALR